MKRYLILEDGTVLTGEAFGAQATTAGEVVFNTGMTGYQETITDFVCRSKSITFTYPLIGNYGMNVATNEAISPSCQGVVVREVARRASHWHNEQSLDDFLRQHGIPGISGVDTRRLTRILREEGAMKGMLTNEVHADSVSHLQAMDLPRNQVQRVSIKQAYNSPNTGKRIVVVDFGFKDSILRELAARQLQVTVVPPTTDAGMILSLHPDGVLLSNGPGDPKDVPYALPMIRAVQAARVPLMGICLGHQLFALANGAKTSKLRFGHRGFNHPVREVATGQTFFTAQNHGYAVDKASLEGTPLLQTYVEINDGTVEGLRHRELPAFSVQFHPDATPGPHDAVGCFDEFERMVEGGEGGAGRLESRA
ncbi:carbamoyl phosphate synthase small subunit [Lacticaseibacillus pantheris]|uniref:carbamoyl phosphate synthase small subunit n=1 Tax=Lacticaseibacillus pantheris TaxID=171523 RepID=UPI0006D0BB30|nr:carbamoyl phosphate synthase small subunit [Lacticaseibacillus pantheris]